MRRALAPLVLLLTVSAFADDITVGWIRRLPELNYVRDSANARAEGWPKAGDVVTWRATVRNFGAAHDNVSYHWAIDGRTVASGRVSLPADSTTAVDLPWSWTFDRHRIAFFVDDANGVAEESETNNSLTVFSDAIAVGFWVERSIYDYFRANQKNLGIGSTCWDNWAQRHIDWYNDIAALAVGPDTPSGVLDRWRLQKIVVVPDGALPLTPIEGVKNDSGEASGSSHPDISDRTVDLMWGFRATTLPTYANTFRADPSNPFYVAPVLVHELGHARYLTDVYAFNVKNSPPGYRIDITDLTRTGDVFFTPDHGLMNDDFTFIDDYSAAALNRRAGMRALEGNYNDPDDVGVFLNDLPAENRLTIRDGFDNLMTDADVWIYQSVGDQNVWYATHYDDTPDLMLRTDANGQVRVGRCPFGSDGKVVNYYAHSNAVAIVRVAKNGQVLYGFLEARLFNLAYWRGETQFADHELVVGTNRVCNSRSLVLRAPAWNATTNGTVTLDWDGTTGATSYDVWASSDLAAPRLIATTAGNEVAVRLNGSRIDWWVVANGNDPCLPRRSSASRLVGTPAAGKRRAVGR
ncbi:MAG TPA: CARDB domain-containing protein [Thermoanaerobaculia bacterium]|nr:CARDB domain-containing protein [Thermoanaerobaculia bacterium]